MNKARINKFNLLDITTAHYKQMEKKPIKHYYDDIIHIIPMPHHN